jgi:hypothetical protein
MPETPQSQNSTRRNRRGAGDGNGFPCRGTNAGRLGDGGGDWMRWLKLNREEVEDNGPFSPVYEPARCSVIRGDFLEERIMSACLVEARVRSRWGGIRKKLAQPTKGLRSTKDSKEIDSPLLSERRGDCVNVPARLRLYSASALRYQHSLRQRLKAQSMGQLMLNPNLVKGRQVDNQQRLSKCRRDTRGYKVTILPS